MATSTELFNKLLKESMENQTNVVIDKHGGNTDTITHTGTEVECCLITGEPLEKSHIILSCNHKFNYMPLHNTTVRWKENGKNKYYCDQNKINMNTNIICPYCRSPTLGVLPWYKSMNVPKLKYINIPFSRCFMYNKCVHKLSSGKRKGTICGKRCVSYDPDNHYLTFLCGTHQKYHTKYDENGELKSTNTKPTTNLCGCQHLLSRGKRKGEKCAKPSRKHITNGDGIKTYYCSNHFNKYQSK
tara:strand:- start:3975 stop:4703 length:729 start_codon:yes stop_codon:yes gene_type:complete